MQRIVAALLVFGAAATAQHIVNTSVTPVSGGTKYTIEFGGPPTGSMIAIMPNQPYSIGRISEQVLPNGTHIKQNSGSFMYRDSLGRRRLDFFYFAGQYSKEGVRVIEIRDWVGEYEYTLDTVNHIAHRMKLPRSLARSAQAQLAPASSAPAPPAPLPDPQPSVVTEALGTQMIDGFLAEGHRTTTTIPIGARGNDQPLEAMDEVWTSSDLEPSVVRDTRTDIAGTQTIEHLIEVSHEEPDPALFQIPADYKIVDETGPFTTVILKP